MRVKTITGIVLIAIGIIAIIAYYNNADYRITDFFREQKVIFLNPVNNTSQNESTKFISIRAVSSEHEENIKIPYDKLLFNLVTNNNFPNVEDTSRDTDFDGIPDYLDKCPHVAGPSSNAGCPIGISPEQNPNIAAANKLQLSPKPELIETYKEIGVYNASKNIVFVYPIFTQAAYDHKGFYDYYNKKCDSSCLTVNIPSQFKGKSSSSTVGSFVLHYLGYQFVTDVDIDKNPDILKKYDKVILLHNEYVTLREFDAITNHPNVMYLYPNALYAEVKTNYNTNTITLVRGHGYPYANMTNGFGWKFDNSKSEYDLQCDNWRFDNIDNGKMLDCYPEFRLLYDDALLREIKNN